LSPFVEGRRADERVPHFGKSDEERRADQKGRKARTRQIRQKGAKANSDGVGNEWRAHAFRHGNATLLDSLYAPMTLRHERLGRVDATTVMGYTHLVTADDVRIAGELGALLDKVFSA